ncbi:MAG TPA: histidine kinase N-terminal domain-containing protein [Ardenticatenaceae bacterium]|jgi:two-component sensor histidine kinase
MDEVQTEQPHLRAVAAGVPILADLHRGDVLLYEPLGEDRLQIVVHAKPHSVPSVYTRATIEREQSLSALPAVARVLNGKDAAEGPRYSNSHRAHIIQRAFAVHDKRGRMAGVLSIEKSLVEHERHATRHPAFRRALEDLRDMALRGETEGFAVLSPFAEADGIALVNAAGTIIYMSGLGSYHYRRLGYSEELVGKPVMQLDTADAGLVERAFSEGKPFEVEHMEQERIWIRKVIPIVGPQVRLPDRLPRLLLPRGLGPLDRRAVLITIHDATSARRKAQETIVRQAMVQEIHHRVKNNLQIIASLLRIQARRAQHEETRQILGESINRILSIAVVHEFLSQHEKAINLRDVANRIAHQVHEGILDSAQNVQVRVEGDVVFLHAHQTTMLALVINELILNALEHGFGDSSSGEVVISFRDGGEDVTLVVRDTGKGLPADFVLDGSGSLGLRIIQTIVEQDMRGSFTLAPVEHGTAATVTFPKAAPETFD